MNFFDKLSNDIVLKILKEAAYNDRQAQKSIPQIDKRFKSLFSIFRSDLVTKNFVTFVKDDPEFRRDYSRHEVSGCTIS